MSNRFEGKIAIVTGGASGIGAATAALFAAEGAKVLVADINEPDFIVDKHIVFHRCDVSVSAEVTGMVEAAIKRFGRLDILFNNAGISVLGETPDLSDEDWHRVLTINLSAAFYACRAAIPHFRKGGGVIVNTTSTSGLGGDPACSAYNASKGALVNYTRSLAIDCAKDNIRVNAVCPGFIAGTGITRAIDAYPAVKSIWNASIPLGRSGTATEVAKVVAFLASDDASYITGAMIVADGGLTARSGSPIPGTTMSPLY